MSKTDPLAIAEGYRNTAKVLTESALSRHLDDKSISKLARQLATITDRGIAEVSAGGEPVACKPGCFHCCRTVAVANPAQCYQVFTELMTWDAARRDAFLERADAFEAAVAAHRKEGFVRCREVCPFLEEGKCSIYAIRPPGCRGLTSVDAKLCEGYAVDPYDAGEFGPNGENQVAMGVLIGSIEIFEQYGARGSALELASTIRQLLKGSLPTNRLFQRPADFQPAVAQPWRQLLSVPVNDPLRGVQEDPLNAKFLALSCEKPLAEILHLIKKPTIRNAFAAMTMPRAFADNDEVDQAFVRFESAIAGLEAFANSDPAEAYVALGDLRTIGVGYLPVSLREPMEKLGQFLVERVAKRIAPELLEPMPPRKPGRLRVGIVGSADGGSASATTLGIVRHLDRQDFEVTVIKVSGTADSTQHAFREAADRFLWLEGHPLEKARLIRSLDLDALLYTDIGDVAGHFQLAVFRLARMQAALWGCPMTTGLPTIDCYIAGESMLPGGAEGEYSEKLVRLTRSGLYLEKPRPVSLAWDRLSLGLPEGPLVTFPQTLFKWLPEWDPLLAEIATRTGNPIVMFETASPFETQVTRERLERAKVPTIWMKRRSLHAYRRILQLCDVALDSPGWSGGLTAVQCLSLGVPIVNLPGPWMRSRLAKAFCSIASVPALCASSVSEYVELACSPDRLKGMMVHSDPDRMYLDLQPVRDLELFLKS